MNLSHLAYDVSRSTGFHIDAIRKILKETNLAIERRLVEGAEVRFRFGALRVERVPSRKRYNVVTKRVDETGVVPKLKVQPNTRFKKLIKSKIGGDINE